MMQDQGIMKKRNPLEEQRGGADLRWGEFLHPRRRKEGDNDTHRYILVYRPTQWLGEEFPMKDDGIISWDGEWRRGKGWEYGCWRANIKPGLQFLPFSFHSQYSSPSSGLNSFQLYNRDGLLRALSHPALLWPLSPLSTHSLEVSPPKPQIHGNLWWASLCFIQCSNASSRRAEFSIFWSNLPLHAYTPSIHLPPLYLSLSHCSLFIALPHCYNMPHLFVFV